jgi:hypothetical protein
MSLLKINTYLIVHAVLFLALGFPLYLKPKLTIGLFHNAPDSVKGETLAILSGWGYVTLLHNICTDQFI